MRETLFVVSLVVIALLGGCGNGRMASPDGAVAPGTDGGPTPGTDAGPTPAHFTATVTGAQSGSYDYTESTSLSGNYVDCSNPGFLGINAALSAGSDPSFTIYLHGYTGPGTYNLTYSQGSANNPNIDVRTGGGYAYEFLLDTSRVTFQDVDSTCTIVVQQTAGSTTRIHGTIACMNLTANITSPDFEMPQTDLQPVVAMTGTFDCDVR